MGSHSQSRGQALVELLFLILFAVCFSLVAQKFSKSWKHKKYKHRYIKKDLKYDQLKVH